MTDLQIRIERPDQPDVVALLDALDHYLGTLYAPEANYILDVQALLAPEIRFLVARLGGRAIGCGAARCMAGEPESGGQAYGEIKRMYVDPGQRGQRIAAKILAALEASLGDEGIRLALLETGAEQIEAVRLYERQGYVQRGPFGGYPDNGLSLFYEKALAPR